jgi:hypothetical protein
MLCFEGVSVSLKNSDGFKLSFVMRGFAILSSLFE